MYINRGTCAKYWKVRWCELDESTQLSVEMIKNNFDILQWATFAQLVNQGTGEGLPPESEFEHCKLISEG